ncbi:VanZ family protein [Butyrivibrio proteoclasticus]|uniref:VanZ family protein n=1 Tax=Butyrivibrio proteoclasticus TaxID=43305 RepID=UPI0006870424|nr:VanZ family protein [Butyrivibrio proteoclasticus]
MDNLGFYFSYFMTLVQQQVDGTSIILFVEMSIVSVVSLFFLMRMYEKTTGKQIIHNKKRAILLMAVYACFIFQIAFYRRIGSEKSKINTWLYFGFRKWDGTVDEKQVVYSFLNVVFFVPWGFLLASAMENNVRRFVMTFFYSLITSLTIEVLQYLTKTGTSEITDLVTNVSGGLIGCLLFVFISNVFNRRSNERR